MSKNKLDTGTVHTIPADLQKILISSRAVQDAWNDLTPLARNEWICWATSVKKPETRKAHIERVRTELLAGKRRPCCWIGCIHRTDKAISPSVKSVLERRSRKS